MVGNIAAIYKYAVLLKHPFYAVITIVIEIFKVLVIFVMTGLLYHVLSEFLWCMGIRCEIKLIQIFPEKLPSKWLAPAAGWIYDRGTRFHCRHHEEEWKMRICGLQNLAMVDFPGKLAATVFTGGCNLRCPFCHNAPLVTHLEEAEHFSEEEILDFLRRRQGLLDGVVLSGGEPLLHDGVGAFLRKVRDLGFAVKLDTNGCHPAALADILDRRLVDYVAMDVKNAPARYAETVGIPGFNPAPVEESIRLLRKSTVDYEFRTTLVRELHRPEDLDAIRALAREDKVVAIGEIGLDYYWPENPPRPLQQQVLRSQLALARELSLPVIIHDRDAHADTMAIVREFPGLRGVFHCFAGSVEMARELVDMGWYLSFNGAATFKNARKAPEVIQAVPMDRLMIETDAPYLTPAPYRGRRNDSTYVHLVAEKIAQLRDMTPQEVEQATWENGKRFFGI